MVGLFAAIALVVAGTPAGASEAAIAIAPPFDQGYSSAFCSPPAALSQYRYPTGECQAVADADAHSGRITVDMDLSSPLFGILPFVSSAQADADLYLRHVLPEPATAVRYTVTVLVEQARIRTDALPLGKRTGYVSLDVSAYDQRWSSGQTSTRLLCTCEDVDRSGETVTLEFTLDSERGELVSTPLELYLRLEAGGWVGPGRLDLDVDLTVTSIVAEPI
jgi:hypothetical protein